MRLWHHQLTHLHIHIDVSKNVLLKFPTSKCHNFLIFQPIFIKFSLFCSKTLSSEIKLNLFRISPLMLIEYNNILTPALYSYTSFVMNMQSEKNCLVFSMAEMLYQYVVEWCEIMNFRSAWHSFKCSRIFTTRLILDLLPSPCKCNHRIDLTFYLICFIKYWASKETYHFFRVTLTKIQSINMNHIWTQIRQICP